MTPADADAAVARGARVLDAHPSAAGWRETVRAAIRDGRLDMGGSDLLRGCGCVFAHLHGTFGKGVLAYTGLDLFEDWKAAEDWGVAHGFEGDGSDEQYDELDAAWARLLGAEVPA